MKTVVQKVTISQFVPATATVCPRRPIGHVLKCWPEQFNLVDNGVKRFETRRDDRGFVTGDTVILAEWDPETKQHTGRSVTRAIGYLDRSDCLPKGWCTFFLEYVSDMPQVVSGPVR